MSAKELEAQIKAQEFLLTAFAWRLVKPTEPINRIAHNSFSEFARAENAKPEPDAELINLTRAALDKILGKWPRNI